MTMTPDIYWETNFSVEASMQRMMRVATFSLLISATVIHPASAQTQSDRQGGAQLGEQSALAGKQGQGANTEQATTSAKTDSTPFAAGTAFNAELTSSIDSKKAKSGDAVNARTTDTVKTADGSVLLPRGTKLLGHVTKASSRASGQSESSLALTFDKAVLKNGQQVPLNLAIQALAAPQNSSAVTQDADVDSAGDMAGRSGRGMATGAPGSAGSTVGGIAGGTAGTVNDTGRGVGNTVDSTTNSTAATAGRAGNVGANGAGELTSNSRGVIGLNNLSLGSTAADSAQGSVITSTGKNVHLDSGTRIVFVTTAANNVVGSTDAQPGRKP